MNDIDINTGQRILSNNTEIPNTAVYPTWINSQVSMKHCSLCPGTTEYYCHDCEDDLCRPCKEMHVDILDIKYHHVTVYRAKFNVLRHGHCTEHPKEVIEIYCEQCDIPVCSHCRKHQQHKLENIRTAYQNKLLQFKNILYNARVILNKLKSDLSCHVMTSHKEMNQLKTAMVSMSKRLNNSLDNVQSELSLKYRDLLICRKKNKMKRHIARIQQYEHRYEKSAYRPVQFLRFIKTVHLPQIQDTPKLSQHCLLSLSLLTQKINMGDMIKLLTEIKITESGKQRQAGNELLPTLMSSPVLQTSFILRRVSECFHISCKTPHRFWVSDWENLVLTDTATGKQLSVVQNPLHSGNGIHTLNSEGKLIYIDEEINIICDGTTLIEHTDTTWEPQCVYCSPSSGDLLVGMRGYDTHTSMDIGKVMRYNDSDRPTQTIPQNNTPDNLYQYPRYITENNNGDVVVSDYFGHAVVVTSGEGIHRFSYKGPLPSGPLLSPRGICTDVLSHILVCDARTDTVHMLNQDGEFLKYILTDQSPGINHFVPFGLSYDFYNHCLWVGSGTWTASGTTVCVYRHINRHPAILDPK